MILLDFVLCEVLMLLLVMTTPPPNSQKRLNQSVNRQSRKRFLCLGERQETKKHWDASKILKEKKSREVIQIACSKCSIWDQCFSIHLLSSGFILRVIFGREMIRAFFLFFFLFFGLSFFSHRQNCLSNSFLIN